MSNKILITGATGYIGGNLASKYLECTDDLILLMIRAKNKEDYQSKVEKLNSKFCFPENRVSYFVFDLTEDHPLAKIDTKSIKSIIHSAANTRFDVVQDDAARVNVQGTNKILQFADSCPSLEQIGLLSTIYSSGLLSGVVDEKPLSNDLGFANYYEWSKWELEQLVYNNFAHLPCSIFRSATIIADHDGGHVTQYNVFHNTIKLIYQGLLTLLPGNSETPIYLVTGEFVTNTIFHILNFSSPQKKPMFFNLAHSKKHSVTLGEIINIVFDVFSQDEQFIKRRISRPKYIDASVFDIVTNQVESFGSASMRLAISSMQPFAQQLFVAKDIKNDQMASKSDLYLPPISQEIITKTCQFLLNTNWGKSTLTVN